MPDPITTALNERDAHARGLRRVFEREIERALKQAERLAHGCDLVPAYEPNLKAIKSCLRQLCAAERRYVEALDAADRREVKHA